MYYLASDQMDCREGCRQEGLGTIRDPGIQEEAVSLKRGAGLVQMLSWVDPVILALDLILDLVTLPRLFHLLLTRRPHWKESCSAGWHVYRWGQQVILADVCHAVD